MKNKESKKKSKASEKPVVLVVYEPEKPVQRTVIQWGKYSLVSEVTLEKSPKKIAEERVYYD